MSRKHRTSRRTDRRIGPELASGDVGARTRKPQGRLNRSRLSKWGSRRINRRAAKILLAVIATVALLYYPVVLIQERTLRQSALAQSRKMFDAGQMGQALLSLDAYLETWPEDIPGLEMRGELLAKAAPYASFDEVLMGVNALDKLLRIDPDPPGRQEDRKRLVLLSVRLGDIVRAASARKFAGIDKIEGRYQFAQKLAEQRIKLGADDGESHRLLATTLERLAIAGDNQASDEAIKEYQKALRRDPGDFASAERLASLRIERKKDQAGADQILDNLIKARPKSVDARLVRARHFLKTGREDRAKADVEAATRLAGSDPGVRMMAASLALRRGDVATARRHLAAIPEANRGDSRLDILLAQLEFFEKRPEQAIEKFRAGLLRTSGTDRELNWRLSYSLIQLGRAADARPLMVQYRRLCGRDDHPMLRLLEGLIREKGGRFLSAIEVLEPAREEIDAEWKGELDLVLGRCHEAVGDVKAARADFLQARDLMPSSPTPHQALARLLLKTEPDRAIAELEEGIRLAHGTPSLLADLAMAHVAKQLALPLAQRNWSAAEAAVDRGLRAKADDPAVIRAKSMLLAAAGRLDEAGSTLEEATKGVARGREEAWQARAQFLVKRDRPDEALRVLEEGSGQGAAGDKAALRAARAELLARSGHGRLALEVLTLGVEKFSAPDRAMLARSKANLLLSLGDRAGARLACLEWAGLAPEDQGPGLKLVEMARKGGTAEEMERGIELLRKVGGEDEPLALAAEALDILLPPGGDDAVDPSRLDQAESLSQRLTEAAPNLSITALVRALLFERSSGFEEAIADYKAALKGDTTGLALPRLVGLLTRLKRDGDLAALKTETPSSTAIDRLSLQETLESGDKDQAQALLTRLVETQPDSLEYRANLAQILRDLGRPEQAEATLRALVDRRPDRPQPWLALLSVQFERGDRAAVQATIERLKVAYKGARPDLLVARCLWTVGDRDAVAKTCEQALAAKPDDLETIRLASEVEEAMGRDQRAEALLAKARKIDPTLPWARRRLALILSSRPNFSRWSEARALAAPAGPPGSGSLESPEDRMLRAVVLERGPDPSHRAEAISVYRALAEDLPALHPVARKARFTLARLLLAAGDPGGASHAIAPLAIESASPDPASLALAIEALAVGGKAEEARPILDRLAKIEPDSPATVVSKAVVLKAEGDLEAAIAAIVEAAAAAEKTPGGEGTNRYYFDQLARLGADSAAEQLGRNIVRLWPAQGSALARFLVNRDRSDEALDACRAAVEAGQGREPLSVLLGMNNAGRLDGPRANKARDIAISAAIRLPSDSEVLAKAAFLLRHQRQFEEEAALYRKLLADNPSNITARNNLAWVLSHDLGQSAEALVEVDRVIRQAGAVPAAIDTRGMVLAKLGRIDEAIAEFERATKVDPSAIHHIHLARAYGLAGRLGDRRRNLEAARLATSNLAVLEPEDRAELDAKDLR